MQPKVIADSAPRDPERFGDGALRVSQFAQAPHLGAALLDVEFAGGSGRIALGDACRSCDPPAVAGRVVAIGIDAVYLSAGSRPWSHVLDERGAASDGIVPASTDPNASPSVIGERLAGSDCCNGPAWRPRWHTADARSAREWRACGCWRQPPLSLGIRTNG
jgi:hypothetical protein